MENKCRKITENNFSSGEYFYDGDGKRVKKVTANETVIFVYDAIGKLIAEYSTQLSQTPQVAYLTNDHLGSPRINTDALGSVISRHDYQPFGEEIERASYGTDDIRKQFTGYERDKETDLDFAQARMYNKNHGRFTSPDPLLGSGRQSTPKTWNRYVYVLNNPLKLVDPSGMLPSTDEEEEQQQQEKQQKNKVVYVFVGFSSAEMNLTSDKTKKGPDFSSLAGVRNGIEVRVIDESTGAGIGMTKGDMFNEALKDPNAIGVFYIGHSIGVTEQSYTANGIAPEGDSSGLIRSEDAGKNTDVKAGLIGIFSCDSKNIAGSFLGSNNSSTNAVIGVNSGQNGLTSMYGIAQAGFTAVNTFISGKNPDEVTKQANVTLKKVEAMNLSDKNDLKTPLDKGDSIVRIK